MLTVLHVVFGAIALGILPGALLARKGGLWHQRWGIIFTISMFVVLFTAGFLWQAKGHLFLVPLGAVSAYLIFSGWRAVARRRRKRPDPIEDAVDMLAAGVAIVAGAGAAVIGATASTPLLISIAPALFGIGAIAICFGLNELLGFRTPRTRTGWLLGHLSAMLAAYVSSITAFIVINAHHVPMIFRWLVPGAIGAATIVAYSTRVLWPVWKAQIMRRRPTSDVA
jgi:hypothetical protein